MREIHDFEAIRNWRWKTNIHNGSFVHSDSGSYREMRIWKREGHYDSANILHCTSIGSTLLGADFCESLRRPDFVTIRMIERGSLLILVEHRRLLRCEAGEICLLPPFRDYAEAPDGGECLNHYLTLHGELLPEILRWSGLDEICDIRPPATEEFAQLLEKGFALPRGNSVRERAANAGFCLELLQTLSAWRTGDALPPELAAATEFIDRHLAESLSTGRLAAAAGVSVNRIYQLFREIFRTSPYRYVIERRMEFARRSLRKGVPIKEIARACGYSNRFNFSAEFKKFHGVSPRGFAASIAEDAS